jgi:hypothetical protein
MEELIENYLKYRWFFTSGGKLVIGGKSAEQNEKLMKKILSIKDELIITHTSSPGSPFCVLLDKKATRKDIEEMAIFTGCFSQAWKSGKVKAKVDLFTNKNIVKSESMKLGTWGVLGKNKSIEVKLELALVEQKGKLRAVPLINKNENNVLFKIRPGKIPKDKLYLLVKDKLGRFKNEDLISALPAGGLTCEKN